MHVEPHHTADELAELIRTERRAKVACRLSAVRLAVLGHTALDVAERVLEVVGAPAPAARHREHDVGNTCCKRVERAHERR